MKLRNVFFAAAAAALSAAPAVAAPMIQFVDNLDSSVTLQVVLDVDSAIGTEMAVSIDMPSTLTLTGATVNEVAFDQPNPGDNPFIPGSPVGGDNVGLSTNFADGWVFASFGGDPGIGTHDFITLDYSGFGSFTASGIVAQAGATGDVLTASISVVPEPSAAILATLGLMAASTLRRSA